MAQQIREVMTSSPATCPQDASVQEAARAMRDSDIGDVIVIDDSQRLRGIVTDRDIAVRAVAEGRDPGQTQIAEIVTEDVQSLSPDDSVEDAIKLMSRRSIRRIPVVENGSPVGVVSIGDLAQERDPKSVLADISESPPNN